MNLYIIQLNKIIEYYSIKFDLPLAIETMIKNKLYLMIRFDIIEKYNILVDKRKKFIIYYDRINEEKITNKIDHLLNDNNLDFSFFNIFFKDIIFSDYILFYKNNFNDKILIKYFDYFESINKIPDTKSLIKLIKLKCNLPQIILNYIIDLCYDQCRQSLLDFITLSNNEYDDIINQCDLIIKYIKEKHYKKIGYIYQKIVDIYIQERQLNEYL